MTPLGREIVETIAQEGPVTVARYMALCLGHPVHGYYATRDPFGAAGDFVTAPEISQMFGELLGLWCAEVWRAMGAPPRVALIELGPGRGTLMADALRAAKAAPGFRDAVEVTLVETSPTLREEQARTLEGTGVAVRWVGTVEDALEPSRHPGRSEAESRDRRPDKTPSSDHDPGSTADAAVRDDEHVPILVLVNEFFDALPVRQFVRTANGWRERMVGLGVDGALAFGLASEPPSDVKLPDRPEGFVLELNPEAQAIAARLGAHVKTHGGAVLAIDYGDALSAGDTLQAVRAHAFADPFQNSGEADLTSQVDFGALACAAASAGAAPMRLLPQADLLERLGIRQRADRLKRDATPDQRAAIDAAVARLTDRAPRAMGALFKAFAFADPRLGPLPAFESSDGAF